MHIQCLKGPLLFPNVLDWITTCELKLTGCKLAPCRVLELPLSQLDTTSFYKFFLASIPTLVLNNILCHCVINYLYVGLLSCLLFTSSSRYFTRPWICKGEQNTDQCIQAACSAVRGQTCRGVSVMSYGAQTQRPVQEVWWGEGTEWCGEEGFGGGSGRQGGTTDCMLPESRGQSHTQQWFPDLGIPQLYQPGCCGCKQQIPILNHLSKRGI